MRTASRTQFWATDAQPIPLQQSVQQQDKNQLIDHQRKRSRGKSLQIREALQLSMSFFNASAQAIQIARLHCMGDPSGIEQHPVFVTTITIDLTIDHRVERHRAGRERLQVNREIYSDGRHEYW